MSSLPNLPAATLEVRRVLDDLFERFGEPARIARAGRGKPWVFVLKEHVVYLSADDDAATAVALERERLEWAHSQSIPVPLLVESGDGYFVVQRVPNDPARGERYVKAAIEASDRIAAADPPPLHPKSGARESPRRTIPLRAFKMATAMVDPIEFVRCRSRVRGLPRKTLSHGDFHHNNVLFDTTVGSVAVIDWSYLGYQPKGADLLFFWTQLSESADRDLVLQAAIERTDDRKALADLHHWIAIRTLVEAATERSWRPWDSGRAPRYRAILAEARANTAWLRGRPVDVTR